MSSSSTASSRSASGSSTSPGVYVAVLLAGVAVVLAATELLLRLLVVPLEEGWSHRVDLVYSAHGGDVVLGDSHTFRGFVTQDEFVNLSAGGSSAQAMEIVAREYFRHRDPGRVIVAASPQFFGGVREKAGTQQHDEYFGQNWGLPVQLYVFEPGIARQVGELLDPWGLLDRRRTALRRRDPRNTVDDFLQRKMMGLNESELTEQARRVARKNRPLPDLRTTEAYGAYGRMLAFLQERGARLCMLRTAVIPRVEELTADDPLYQDAHRQLRELARELGIRYVDYRDLGIPFKTEMFIDPDHLTARGAHLFAQRAIQACFGSH